MTTKLEQVAIGIENEASKDGLLMPATVSVRYARAALEALREPPSAMKTAWNAALDAILNEKPE